MMIITIQEEILQCAICISMLDENSKMLPCQHTFCKGCLENLLKGSGPFLCPMCRQAAPSIQNITHVEQLPGNLVINNLIGEIKKNLHIRKSKQDENMNALFKSANKKSQPQVATYYHIKTRSQTRKEEAIRLKIINMPSKRETYTGVTKISPAVNSGGKAVKVTSKKRSNVISAS